MKFNRIYVAATSQHVGKTTSTLGLVHALRQRGLNVGYCKPVGQKALRFGDYFADKDAILFADFMKFEAQPDLHSPVILGKGATKAYLDNPGQYPYANKIVKASKILQQRHDIVVYEGTGHPGVGSVVNLSNAKVAELLGAGLIMVVEAGIGSTIDSLDLNLSVFEQKKIPIIGVIINKAIRSKIEDVRHYVGRKLEERGIRLLGIMPYEEELGLPLMGTVCQAINGEVLYNKEFMTNRVEGMLAGSLIDLDVIKNSKNLLLVVSVNRLDDALKKLDAVNRRLGPEGSKKNPLAGVILTGKTDLHEGIVSYFQEHKIPVIKSMMDTYESVIKISNIEVKINTKTPWKVTKAVSLFKEHVDLRPVFEVESV
ncbi:MAG: AAA family ATPase [Bacteroidota bacterium]